MQPHCPSPPLLSIDIGPLDGNYGSRRQAEGLYREGAHVILHYGNDKDSAQATADRLGNRSKLVQDTLRDPAERPRVWTEAADWRDGVDVLVNNAGAWLASDTAGCGN